MAQVQKRSCMVHCNWLLYVGIVLLMVELAHAATQTVPCSEVNGSADGLITAIEAANDTPGPNTIELAPGCVYTLTTQYPGQSQNGLPPITDILTIQGHGSTIAASPTSTGVGLRIFAVVFGGNLTLNRVTVKGGHTVYVEPIPGDAACLDKDSDPNAIPLEDAGRGAGLCVDAQSHLTLNHSTITKNSMISNFRLAAGGGIFGGDVTLNHSLVSNNTASNSTDYGVQGGGIASMTLRVYCSRITRNTAYSDSSISNVFAGGIAAGRLIMRDSVVSYNTVRSDSSVDANVLGGGMLIGDGSIVRHSVIRNNLAIANGNYNVKAEAAGIGEAGNITLDHAFISGNVTIARILSANSTSSAVAKAGGLSIGEGKTALLHTVIHHNVARASQGEASGGGIYNHPTGTVTLKHTAIVNNIAQGATTGTSLGGGIYNANSANGSLTLIDVTVKGNHPDQGDPAGNVPLVY